MTYMVTDRYDSKGNVYDRTPWGPQRKANDRCVYEGCRDMKWSSNLYCSRHGMNVRP